MTKDIAEVSGEVESEKVDEQVLAAIKAGIHKRCAAITRHLGFVSERVTDKSLQRLRKKGLIWYGDAGEGACWKAVTK